MTKQQYVTESAPGALGPYSQAIEANGFVYCAGQLGVDPKTGEFAGETIQEQTGQALRNLNAVLDAAGLTLADAVKTTCFLADMADFGGFNEAYKSVMPDPYPARSTFAVKELPRHGRVEIELIAARPSR
jgi:2-iminobutanoate/2-iminopropanoate deaminase